MVCTNSNIILAALVVCVCVGFFVFLSLKQQKLSWMLRFVCH